MKDSLPFEQTGLQNSLLPLRFGIAGLGTERSKQM